MNLKKSIIFFMIVTAPIIHGMVEKQEANKPNPLINTLKPSESPIDDFIAQWIFHINTGISKVDRLATIHNLNRSKVREEFLEKLKVQSGNKPSIQGRFIIEYTEMRKRLYGNKSSQSEPSALQNTELVKVKEDLQNFNIEIEATNQWNLIMRIVNPPASCCVIL